MHDRATRLTVAAEGRETGLSREGAAFGELVGTSSRMKEPCTLLRKIGPSDASVRLIGESGTGKELAARTLHALSPRASNPFIAVKDWSREGDARAARVQRLAARGRESEVRRGRSADLVSLAEARRRRTG